MSRHAITASQLSCVIATGLILTKNVSFVLTSLGIASVGVNTPAGVNVKKMCLRSGKLKNPIINAWNSLYERKFFFKKKKTYFPDKFNVKIYSVYHHRTLLCAVRHVDTYVERRRLDHIRPCVLFELVFFYEFVMNIIQPFIAKIVIVA